MANTTYTKDIYGVQQQLADEQAAQEQGYITDAVNLASVQGAGMMLNARDIGMRQGNVYANIGRMLTGEEEAVDPRMARMQKLQAIMEQVPEPDTVDEYIQLANLMNQAGLYGEAAEAMKMANEIRSSMPTPQTSKQIATQKFLNSEAYKTGKETMFDFEKKWTAASTAPAKKDKQVSKDIALQNFLKGDDYIGNPGGTKTMLDFERDWTAASSAPKDSKAQTSKEIALADFLVSPEYQGGKKSVTQWEAEWNEATAAPKSGGGEVDDLALELLINSPTYKDADSNAQVEMLIKHKEDWGDDGYRFDYLKNLDDMKKEINPDTGELFTHAEAMAKLDFIKRRQVSEEVEIAAAKSRIESRDVIVKTYNDDASVAWDEIQSLERILKAYKDGAVSGQLKSTMTKLAGIMDSLGFQIDKEKLVSTELLITEFADIALQRMGQLSGSASDNDIIFVKEGAANIKNTKETNMLLVDMALYYAKEKQEAADFLSTYLSSQTETPESWEITAMMEAFKNRGDSSERALAKYGAAWKAAGLDREQAVARHGDNQFKREKRLSDLQALSPSDSAIAIQQDVDLEALDQILD